MIALVVDAVVDAKKRFLIYFIKRRFQKKILKYSKLLIRGRKN